MNFIYYFICRTSNTLDPARWMHMHHALQFIRQRLYLYVLAYHVAFRFMLFMLQLIELTHLVLWNVCHC